MKHVMPLTGFFLFLMLGVFSCKTKEELVVAEEKYLRYVGDIVFDARQDDPQFKTCYGNDVYQYFNFSNGLLYEGEKKALERAFHENYQPVCKADQSGLLRIRFVVNCQGTAGMFRLMSMDEEYREKVFDTAITEQLLQITSSLKGWKQQPDAANARDYYQYLIFKLHQGNIQEILP